MTGMRVIPVINCPDLACVRKKIEVVKSFLHEGELVHLDVTDGSFSSYRVWGDPLGWSSLAAPFGLEAHLMVDHPEQCADDWLAAGARRLILHVETLTPATLHDIASIAEQHHAEIMLSSKPETPAEDLEPYLRRVSAFQVLAVPPGPSAQPFLPFVREKIVFLRERVPDATIEVDGGMDPATVRLVKGAGADTIVSSSYLFGAADPARAYRELTNI